MRIGFPAPRRRTTRTNRPLPHTQFLSSSDDLGEPLTVASRQRAPGDPFARKGPVLPVGAPTPFSVERLFAIAKQQKLTPMEVAEIISASTSMCSSLQQAPEVPRGSAGPKPCRASPRYGRSGRSSDSTPTVCRCSQMRSSASSAATSTQTVADSVGTFFTLPKPSARSASSARAQVAMFYARLYTRALRPACSLTPHGPTSAQRAFDRLDAALANFLAGGQTCCVKNLTITRDSSVQDS